MIGDTMDKTALITGISGQDGSYLAELLLDLNYTVVGMVRRLSHPNIINIEHIKDEVTLEEGDLTDQSSINTIVRKHHPDEVYNIASQSFVGASWKQPVLTSDVTGLGALRVFEAVRMESPESKIYQAGSSEMFGKVTESTQTEHTQFHPRSPYGAAKALAHYLAVNYRESYNMFISNGILFNHESERRGIEFVTKKIAVAAARIAAGIQKTPLELGNIDTKRDWGYAPEYVEAMWCMMQEEHPGDYVIATGEAHSIKEFVIEAFKVAGIDLSNDEAQWSRSGYVKCNTIGNVRPADVNLLCGDASKARRELGWVPKIKFKKLVKIMVEHEMRT